jgi:pimeloyl-ACP methyl ester carboxylesterase
MQTIRSTDGTPIAYQQSGQGSPLILVHGTTADHTRWAPILPIFERQYTVYAIDRRGRGESGDDEQYAIEREFEDIVAVINSIDEPVFLLGHSYGAICSLEASRRTTRVRKLVLYEPPIPTGIEIYPHEIVNRIQALLDVGDREGALITFMQDIVHVPPHEMELLRSAPSWPARIAAAHTILREMRGSNEYVFEPAHFSKLRTPTLLLLGGDSPAFFKAGIEAVHAALPNSQVVVMPGQQHTAMNTAPELFTREVYEFLPQVS